MMCGKCNGRGVVANPRYYRHSNSEAWEMGIPATKPCKHCGGSGYIIGNIGDIVERLRVAANGVTITKREAKQMLDAILKKGGEQ